MNLINITVLNNQSCAWTICTVIILFKANIDKSIYYLKYILDIPDNVKLPYEKITAHQVWQLEQFEGQQAQFCNSNLLVWSVQI